MKNRLDIRILWRRHSSRLTQSLAGYSRVLVVPGDSMTSARQDDLHTDNWPSMHYPPVVHGRQLTPLPETLEAQEFDQTCSTFDHVVSSRAGTFRQWQQRQRARDID